MGKRGKKYIAATEGLDRTRSYDFSEALKFAVDTSYAKFDQTVDVAVRLGVDPRHADQMVRGSVMLPNGTGKEVRVLVFAKGEKEKEAQDAGADFVGNDELLEKIQGGWLEFDKAVATPDMMGSVGRTGLARALLGSVAEKVARELPCSIMTVKGEDFVRLQLLGEIEDIREHVEQAERLLEKGFAKEALGELRHCIARDPMYAPAWEGAAAAHERLGNQREAEQCRQRSAEIVRALWDRRIEAEIRSQRLLWKK